MAIPSLQHDARKLPGIISVLRQSVHLSSYCIDMEFREQTVAVMTHIGLIFPSFELC